MATTACFTKHPSPWQPPPASPKHPSPWQPTRCQYSSNRVAHSFAYSAAHLHTVINVSGSFAARYSIRWTRYINGIFDGILRDFGGILEGFLRDFGGILERFWRDFGGISCMDAAMQWERERPRLDFNYFGGQATIDWYQSAGNQSDRLVTINVNLRRFIASGLVNITLPSLTGNKWYFVIISIIVIHFFPFTIRYEFKRQVEPVALETARWLAISPTLVWRISWISHPKFAYYVPELGT